MTVLAFAPIVAVALHPAVVHAPIVLLLVAPVVVLAAVAFRSASRVLMPTALALMAAGTLGAVVAVATGETDAERAVTSAAAEVVLERHEELGALARTVFVVLTAIFAVLCVGWQKAPPGPGCRRVLPAAAMAFVVVYLGAAVLLVAAAHQGGRLVHEFGVLAAGGRASGTSPDGAATALSGHDDDER